MVFNLHDSVDLQLLTDYPVLLAALLMTLPTDVVASVLEWGRPRMVTYLPLPVLAILLSIGGLPGLGEQENVSYDEPESYATARSAPGCSQEVYNLIRLKHALTAAPLELVPSRDNAIKLTRMVGGVAPSTFSLATIAILTTKGSDSEHSSRLDSVLVLLGLEPSPTCKTLMHKLARKGSTTHAATGIGTQAYVTSVLNAITTPMEKHEVRWKFGPNKSSEEVVMSNPALNDLSMSAALLIGYTIGCSTPSLMHEEAYDRDYGDSREVPGIYQNAVVAAGICSIIEDPEEALKDSAIVNMALNLGLSLFFKKIAASDAIALRLHLATLLALSKNLPAAARKALFVAYSVGQTEGSLATWESPLFAKPSLPGKVLSQVIGAECAFDVIDAEGRPTQDTLTFIDGWSADHGDVEAERRATLECEDVQAEGSIDGQDGPLPDERPNGLEYADHSYQEHQDGHGREAQPGGPDTAHNRTAPETIGGGPRRSQEGQTVVRSAQIPLWRIVAAEREREKLEEADRKEREYLDSLKASGLTRNEIRFHERTIEQRDEARQLDDARRSSSPAEAPEVTAYVDFCACAESQQHVNPQTELGKVLRDMVEFKQMKDVQIGDRVIFPLVDGRDVRRIRGLTLREHPLDLKGNLGGISSYICVYYPGAFRDHGKDTRLLQYEDSLDDFLDSLDGYPSVSDLNERDARALPPMVLSIRENAVIMAEISGKGDAQGGDASNGTAVRGPSVTVVMGPTRRRAPAPPVVQQGVLLQGVDVERSNRAQEFINRTLADNRRALEQEIHSANVAQGLGMTEHTMKMYVDGEMKRAAQYARGGSHQEEDDSRTSRRWTLEETVRDSDTTRAARFRSEGGPAERERERDGHQHHQTGGEPLHERRPSRDAHPMGRQREPGGRGVPSLNPSTERPHMMSSRFEDGQYNSRLANHGMELAREREYRPPYPPETRVRIEHPLRDARESYGLGQQQDQGRAWGGEQHRRPFHGTGLPQARGRPRSEAWDEPHGEENDNDDEGRFNSVRRRNGEQMEGVATLSRRQSAFAAEEDASVLANTDHAEFGMVGTQSARNGAFQCKFNKAMLATAVVLKSPAAVASIAKIPIWRALSVNPSMGQAHEFRNGVWGNEFTITEDELSFRSFVSNPKYPPDREVASMFLSNFSYMWAIMLDKRLLNVLDPIQKLLDDKYGEQLGLFKAGYIIAAVWTGLRDLSVQVKEHIGRKGSNHDTTIRLIASTAARTIFEALDHMSIEGESRHARKEMSFFKAKKAIAPPTGGGIGRSGASKGSHGSAWPRSEDEESISSYSSSRNSVGSNQHRHIPTSGPAAKRARRRSPPPSGGRSSPAGASRGALKITTKSALKPTSASNKVSFSPQQSAKGKANAGSSVGKTGSLICFKNLSYCLKVTTTDCTYGKQCRWEHATAKNPFREKTAKEAISQAKKNVAADMQPFTAALAHELASGNPLFAP